MADRSKVPRNPTAAATVWAPVAAALLQAHYSEDTKRTVSELIANAFASRLENHSGTEIGFFDQCRSLVEQHPDHRDDLREIKLFDTVLL